MKKSFVILTILTMLVLIGCTANNSTTINLTTDTTTSITTTNTTTTTIITTRVVSTIAGTLTSRFVTDTYSLFESGPADGLIYLRQLGDTSNYLDLTCGEQTGSLYPQSSRYFQIKSGEKIILGINEDIVPTAYEISWEFIPYSAYSNSDINLMIETEEGNNVIGIGAPSYVSYVAIKLENDTTIGLTDLIYASYYNSLPSGLNYQLCTEDGTIIMDESDWTNQINLNSGNYYIEIHLESGNEAFVSFSYTIVDE